MARTLFASRFGGWGVGCLQVEGRRCRVNMAHLRQARFFGFQPLKYCKMFPSSLGSGYRRGGVPRARTGCGISSSSRDSLRGSQDPPDWEKLKGHLRYLAYGQKTCPRIERLDWQGFAYSFQPERFYRATSLTTRHNCGRRG